MAARFGFGQDVDTIRSKFRFPLPLVADMLEANIMKVSQHQLSLLRTLRNQAVLAIKQKV